MINAKEINSMEPTTQQLKLQNLPAGLTEATVKAHVIAPAHVRDIQIEKVDPALEVIYKIQPVIKDFKPTLTPKVDIGAFGTVVHTILKDSVTGYILQVRQNGNLVYNLIWNWAQTPADLGQGWTEDTRMHVASVSKFLTAVGLVKVLDSKNISYDAAIVDYLPTYWSKGNNISKITFRHLLTHTSGFATGSSASDYVFMKSKVAGGVSNVGSYDYENMNFGLCRILIPIINGNVSKGTQFFPIPAVNDQAWDAVTLYHYRNYMQTNVFTPAGVNNVGFEPILVVRMRWLTSFHITTRKDGIRATLLLLRVVLGWRLSTKELLNVMNHARRKNTIISASKAQYMLDNSFGIDQRINTAAGRVYNKNGAWGNQLVRNNALLTFGRKKWNS
jgi:hypothetical protein